MRLPHPVLECCRPAWFFAAAAVTTTFRDCRHIPCSCITLEIDQVFIPYFAGGSWACRTSYDLYFIAAHVLIAAYVQGLVHYRRSYAQECSARNVYVRLGGRADFQLFDHGQRLAVTGFRPWLAGQQASRIPGGKYGRGSQR